MKKLIVTIVVCGIGLCGMAAPLAAAGKAAVFSLRGHRRSAVILRAEESTDHAATLAKYLKEIVGSDVAVITGPAKAPAGALKIHVGRDAYVRSLKLDFDSLHPYGYYLKLTDGDNLVIAGKYRGGTDYAVFDFLKRYGGYRRFGDGDLAEIVPKTETIELPASMDFKEQPSLRLSYGRYSGPFGRNTRVCVMATHNFEEIYPPKKYGATHPEYYGMYEGKRAGLDRLKQGDWQLCVSSPDVPGIAVQFARRVFAQDPTAMGLSLGVNDGPLDCQCPECRKLREKYVNSYIPYVNEVARRFQKEFPGKFVGFLNYAGAGPAPRRITIEPNVYVELMGGGFPNDFEKLKAWRAAGARRTGMYAWTYGSFDSGYVVPRHYPHVLGKAWKKAYKDYGFQGVFYDPGSSGTWLFEGPRNYVLDELAWNIDADIDRLLDDYFAKMYAQAAPHVRRFFDRVEEIYSRKADPLAFADDCIWSGGDPLDQFAEYTPEDLAYLDAALKTAKASVKDEIAAKRLALLNKLYGLSRLYVEGYLALRQVRDAREVKTAEQPAAVLAAVSRGLKLRAQIGAYPLSKEEKKSIAPHQPPNQPDMFSPEGSDADVPKLLKLALERESGPAFNAMTAFLTRGGEGDWPAARSFWMKAVSGAQDDLIKVLCLTQIYLHEAPDAKRNLLDNPSLEPVQEATKEFYSEQDLKGREWRKLDPHLPGWYTAHVEGDVSKYCWDAGEAHSGQHSLAIGKNLYAYLGHWITSFPVQPGCRYRLAWWVKQKPMPSGSGPRVGSVTLSEGVAQEYKGEYPRGTQSQWRQGELLFTMAAAATRCVAAFGAPRQMEGEFTWIDDVSLVKVYDPAHFTK